MALKFDVSIRNALLNEIVTRAGSGALLRLYNGTRPATGGGSITTQTLLAELTCAATLGSVTGGVLTLGSVTQDSSANNSGTATWFRIVQSDGSTWVMDGDVTASGGGGDITMPSTMITAALPVQMTGTNTITAGNAA